jgi:hypothetical protein
MVKLILLTLGISLIFATENYSQLYRVTTQTNEPIPYVTVYDFDTDAATLTDETGFFRFEPGKKVIFSSLGYLQDTVLLKASPHTSLVILRAKNLHSRYERQQNINFEIREDKTFESGNIKDEMEEYFYLANDDLSLITKIENPTSKTAQLTKVLFNLKIDDSYTLRIRVLSVNPETGEPSEDLLRENVIINELNLLGNYQVDISANAILLPPEGIYIGFDILPVGNEEDLKIKVGLATDNDKSESYIGTILLNKWTLFNTRIKTQEPKGNFMFGIKAIY